ncbi:hypothetical protein EV138_5416 [Kribbella voronezhensis]|uniref:Big-1 domain-containing protein n=1 Tax=Kribbella voronezhensis TaxID=2512212 RepID=A0A4V3FKW5_9ACTN|nr:hypothetical protein [Kribbella voronezhensis]TDU91803.1 hypothetical protein EV138_5416 [Kribbella voronezhensis]
MTAFNTRRRLTWLIAALVTTLIGVTVGIINSTSSFAASSAGSGDGTMGVSPASVVAGSTGNQLVFTFTAPNGKDFAAGSLVTLTVQAGWTPPTTTPGDAGYTTAAAGSGSSCAPGAPSIAGGSGSWTITVSHSCQAGASFTINYGTGSNATHVTAPTLAQPSIFTSASRAGITGTAVNLAGQPQVSVGPAAAAALVFTTSPSTSAVGVAFATQPKLTVVDAFGNTVTNDNSVVTLSITTGTPTNGGPGALSACTQSETNGVIAFAGCKISTSGTAYKLHAVDGSMTAVDSAAFNITAGTASKLAYTTSPPSTGAAGSALSDFRVSVQDAAGNTVTTGNGSVDTISLSIASGPVGGAINSTSSTYTNVTAIGGVATFSGIVFNTPGTYTLKASDTTAGRTGLTTVTSGSIQISAGAASKLVFIQGPSSVFAGGVMTPAVTVQLQDSSGNAVGTSGVSVTLALSAGGIGAGATAATDASGRATFSGVVIDTAAAGLTMTASASGMAAAPALGTFDVTVAVSNGAALTETASDAGAGVKSVAYYYCAGYTGACTSANWTLINSSTSAAGNYLVNWSGQPGNGAYRVVVVGTDNVNYVSQASASIPVTVSN